MSFTHPKYETDEYTGFSKSEYRYKNNINSEIHLSDLKSRKYFSLEEIVESMHMNKILFEFFPNQATAIKDYNFSLTKQNTLSRLPNLNRFSEGKFSTDKFPNFCFSAQDYKIYLARDDLKPCLSLVENNFENIVSFIEKEKDIHMTFCCKSNMSYSELKKRIKNLYNLNLISYQTFFNFMKVYDLLDSRIICYQKSQRKNDLLLNSIESFYNCLPGSVEYENEKSKIFFVDFNFYLIYLLMSLNLRIEFFPNSNKISFSELIFFYEIL